MKRAWNWLRSNSVQIGTIAAIIAAASGAWPHLIHATKWARPPDLLVKFNVEKSTVPPDYRKFAENSALFFLFEKQTPELRSKVVNIFDGQPDESFLEKVRYRANNIDKAQINITNQSSKEISGVKIRLDNVFALWNAEINGSFLDKAEIELLRKKLSHSISGNANIGSVLDSSSVVFPEFPALPPGSSIELTIFGDLSLAKPVIVANGQSSEIKEIVEVEDSSIVQLVNNPGKILFSMLPLLLLFFLLGRSIYEHFSEKQKKILHQSLLYNMACKLAINDNPDGAMLVLDEAVRHGYANHQHALSDEDLASLRERNDFNELFPRHHD
jgi:hypothetical protein